jgi:hypothetical protein
LETPSGAAASFVIAAVATPVIAPAPLAFNAELQRQFVEQRLVELGDLPADAAENVTWLTSAERVGLAAHPGMLQRAGSMSMTTETVIIIVLIVAAIVVLFIVSDSGFIVSN